MIDEFVKGHLEAALYSSSDTVMKDGKACDIFLDEREISEEEAVKLIPDCLAFIAEHKQGLIEYTKTAKINENQTPWKQAGWDFWMTRQGHGVGYWDRDAGDIGDNLSNECISWLHSGLYIGDDGQVYVA